MEEKSSIGGIFWGLFVAIIVVIVGGIMLENIAVEEYDKGLNDGMVTAFDYSHCVNVAMEEKLLIEKQVPTRQWYSFDLPKSCCLEAGIGDEAFCTEWGKEAEATIAGQYDYYLPVWERQLNQR
jgi:hypothetical protein